MREIILITVSGTDQPGITRAITEILARFNVHILDIGQAVIHATLSLGFLVEIPAESESAPVIKEILFGLHSRNLTAQFRPISEEEYNAWVDDQGKPRYIITLLGRTIKAKHLAEVSELIVAQGLNIDKISRLSDRASLDPKRGSKRASIEFSVRGYPTDLGHLREQFLRLSSELGLDIAFQADDIYRRNRRLVVFDMDSTLIQCEVIDELAKEAGVWDAVSSITAAAMRGELEFTQSFEKRLALLKGLPETKLSEVAARLPVTEGLPRLMQTLKMLGFKTAIISGGFTYFAEHLQQMFGFDHIYANTLEIKDGVVTGRVCGPVVDGKRKAEVMKEIAMKEGIRLDQVIAVGDGANDLPMLISAGLGIAFHAKPVVRESAKQALSNVGLDAILYLMGIKDREIQD
jgi:phosphoserine phosphatase